MTKPTIEQVNQILTQANLASVTLTTPSFKLSKVINSIVKDSSLSEETNFERVRVLLKAGILTERDVLELYNNKVEHMDLSYEYCPLVKILAPLERDGTLYLSDSEAIYELSWDLYLDYIKSIVLLGGRVDHDGLLCWLFDDRYEVEMFNYLMDNFNIKKETINYVAAQLLYKQYCSDEDSDEEDRALFNRLIEKGIDINLPFDENSHMSAFHSFLGAALFCSPDLFEQYLLQRPSQEIIENLPWSYPISEAAFTDKHVQLVNKLIELGYHVPVDEIISELEEYEYFDYAKALSH
ncbi:hypothetical protein ACFFUP_13870 [Vibrio ostreicida]|uniref:Ankyrin repeat domain-containing protein n=1 Tax=Vibrio ostreicida TaxID=526588 RepID=A0ABT8BZW6_9VIBR|nr:hypothetical protein [Vibrio ostreicida]MDN3612249.1 hypothetical protein [Vibrio ostreicida]NPD08636.1 hypothetical protein [Vibrio ostreicida]